MDKLFKQITELVPTLGGWCEPDKACHLAAMIIALRPRVTFEIGVWSGASLFPMALAHKFAGYGKITGIDPWSRDAATAGYDGQNLQFWQEMPYEKVYETFMSNVFKLGVADQIEIIRQKSDDVEPCPAIDILHVDGQHTLQALQDVQRFGSCVRVGGIVVMDDIEWTNGGRQEVKEAAVWLENNGFRKLYPLGTGAVYQRLQE